MEAVPLTLYLARRDRDYENLSDVPSQIDIQAATEAWYQKGLADGMERAREAHNAAIARQEEACARKLEQARKIWSETESAVLAQQLSAAMGRLNEEIGGTVARILRPIVQGKLVEDALAKLADEIGKLLSDDDAIRLKICGPADLLARLSSQLPANSHATLVAGDQPEVTVFANKTVMETRLNEWLARIGVDSHAQEEKG